MKVNILVYSFRELLYIDPFSPAYSWSIMNRFILKGHRKALCWLHSIYIYWLYCTPQLIHFSSACSHLQHKDILLFVSENNKRCIGVYKILECENCCPADYSTALLQFVSSSTDNSKVKAFFCCSCSL